MLTSPLRPFVDPLPAPPRLLAREHDGRLTHSHARRRVIASTGICRIARLDLRGEHARAHDRGRARSSGRVEWRNELEGTLPVAVTLAPTETDAAASRCSACPG